jgi:hypothetical protein
LGFGGHGLLPLAGPVGPNVGGDRRAAPMSANEKPCAGASGSP